MSTKEKTREKLVNSMRKTKAVINEQSDSKQAHAETYAPAPTKSAKADKSAAPARIEAVAEKLSSTRPETGGDSYQSRSRVWPD